MKSVVQRLGLFLAFGTAAATGGEPEAELRAALQTLARSTYTWETTVRQRSNGSATNLSLTPNAPLEVTGKTDPSGYTEMTLQPSRQTLDAPVTAFSKAGDVVGHTPLGWLRRAEIHVAAGAEKDRMVPFEGKSVRLSRSFSAALRVTAMQVPTEEALDLAADVKSYRETGGYIFCELRDAAVERLWNEPRARSAPEIQGSVAFKIRDGAVNEYHVVLAIGFPNAKAKTVAWSAMQWTTRFRDIGSTTVAPPGAVTEKLTE